MRPSRDEIGLRLAETWALLGTCARRQVGCVLFDVDGVELSSGYNGPARGQPHCLDTGGVTDRRCPGADCASGTGLELCEAIHAELNAIIKCPDTRKVHTCYVTTSPCIWCIKALLQTSCQRVVFAEEYAHNSASKIIWETAGRDWIRG